MTDTIPLFDAKDIRVLTLEIEGRTLVYAALVGDRDPMELTLDEWRAAPLLSAAAMLDRVIGGDAGKAGAP